MAISAALGSASLLPAGLGFRNVLINGGMDIWQRGTTVKYNSGQGAYGPDRWCGAHQYQTSRTQRVSVTSTSADLWAPYACRVSNPSSTENAAGSRMRLEQKVEALNTYPLRNRTVTLSFWIRFSAANFTATSGSYGNFSYVIGAYTSTTDSATNTTANDVQTSASITAGSFPTTWTKYTMTYLVPATTNNIEVIFGMDSLGIHTSSDVNWYEITQVQLEANYQPTPYEQRPYSIELELCQRYYERYNAEAGGTYTTAPIGANGYYSTTNSYPTVMFKVQKRIEEPSMTVSAVGHFTVYTTGVGLNPTTIAIDNISSHGVSLRVITAAATSGAFATTYITNSNGFLAIDAEL